jgi:hypothetical protein
MGKRRNARENGKEKAAAAANSEARFGIRDVGPLPHPLVAHMLPTGNSFAIVNCVAFDCSMMVES